MERLWGEEGSGKAIRATPGGKKSDWTNSGKKQKSDLTNSGKKKNDQSESHSKTGRQTPILLFPTTTDQNLNTVGET